MRSIYEKISEHYRGIEYQHLFFSVFILGVILFYRISAYFISGSIYADISAVGFLNFFMMSFPDDVFCAAFALGIILLIVSLPKSLRFMPIFLCDIFVCLFAAYHIFALQFLKIYETSFQLSFIGGEHFTGLRGMLNSAAAEITSGTVISFAAVILIVFATSLFLMVAEAKSSLDAKTKYFFVSVSIYLLTLILTVAIASPTEKEIVLKYKIKAPVYELSMSPFSSLALRCFKKPAVQPVPAAVEPVVSSSGFQTDSLESNKEYDLSKIIPKNKKYNIVIYLFESTAYSYYGLRSNGKSMTPVMERLAQNGFLAANHMTNYPLSANALFSITASAYPIIGKDMVFEKNPSIQVNSLTEVLKDNGYRTCYVHTGDLSYAGQMKYLKNRKIDRFITARDLGKDKRYNKKNVGWAIDERAMIDPAVNFMKESSEPFVVIMSPMNPHHPYAVPDDSFKVAEHNPSGTNRVGMWENYLISLHYADYALGELIDKLEAEGLMKDTLFFMLTDHGEAFYQHPQNYNHPLFVYEENIHVPFIIYNKDIFKNGYYFDGITRHVDILPTITDIIGIKDDKHREGFPIFTKRKEKLAFVHTSWKDDLVAVRDVKWKYIYRIKDGNEELYDLLSDPEEKNNLASEKTETALKYRNYVLSGIDYVKNYHKNN
ncbi:MAG TPA: sulfatase-like hydrolase/transferase [Spirochaetota bacterium]|nr:sulfatase-like hydrolase/transferase [Spirochaetota bacterium]